MNLSMSLMYLSCYYTTCAEKERERERAKPVCVSEIAEIEGRANLSCRNLFHFHLSRDGKDGEAISHQQWLHRSLARIFSPSFIVTLLSSLFFHSCCFSGLSFGSIHGAMSNVSIGPKSIQHNNPFRRKQKQKWHYPFWFGGSAASMAAVVTHPLDLGMHLY